MSDLENFVKPGERVPSRNARGALCAQVSRPLAAFLEDRVQEPQTSPDDRAIPMSTTLPRSAGEQDAPVRVFSMLGILIKDSRARLRWAGEHPLLRTRSMGCSPIPAL